MFSGCTSLINVNKLPADFVYEKSYYEMFKGCTSLTVAPELPARFLGVSCYEGMFSNCEKLIVAPKLQSMSVSEKCYRYMFYKCTSLTTAPELPATTLEKDCYGGMFEHCENLTIAPELPAATLVDECYSHMFWGCKQLKSLIVNFTLWGNSSSNSTAGWLSLVASNGILFCPVSLAQEFGYRGIPEGWKVAPIEMSQKTFSIAISDDNVTIDKTTAKYSDVINVAVKDRSNDYYQFEKLLVNGVAIRIVDFKGSFMVADFLEDIIIESVYSYKPPYTVKTDEYCTADKTTAFVGEVVCITIAKRAGYNPAYAIESFRPSIKHLIKDYKVTFVMPEQDVEVDIVYTPIPYTITTDEFSQVANTTATVDDAITVTFKQREGYDLTSATYNGNPLNIKDYKTTFTMPAQDVDIKTVYTEKVYEIEKPSEGVSVSQPSAKAGDEITISVNPKDGYTVHLYVNGAEVALSGNSAVYTMPSGKIEITVKYVVEEKTPISEIELDNCSVSVFPNPAKSGEEITLKVGGKFDMNNAKIYLYNASGSLVMQIVDVKEYNNLTLQSGVYVGVLVTKGGKKTFRVAVK